MLSMGTQVAASSPTLTPHSNGATDAPVRFPVHAQLNNKLSLWKGDQLALQGKALFMFGASLPR